MPIGMELSPELEQEGQHESKGCSCSMNLCVASRAKRGHQVKKRLARNSVVNDDGTFVAPGCIAYAAAVSLPFQNVLSQSAEVFSILSLERVADSTNPMRKDLCPSAGAMHRVLFELRHHPFFRREGSWDPTSPASLLMYS